MADSSARRIEYEPSKQNGSKKRQRIILDPRKVPYNWVEKNKKMEELSTNGSKKYLSIIILNKYN